jgi:hypothetical protein
MKMFEQVRVPDSRKGSDYIVTAEINRVANDDREGPYYFVQKVDNGKIRRIKRADFKKGKFYHHSEVMVLS